MNYGKNAAKRRESQIEAKGKKIRNKFGVIIGRILLVCLLFAAVVGISSGIGVWKGIIDSAPDISAMDVTPTGFSTTVYASDGQEVATLVAAGANRKYVTIDEIPLNLQHAFVAIEDSRFYEHNGIDPKGIVRAFFSGVTNGFNFDQGASTITQQLIKNSVLSDSWTNELNSSATGKTSFIEKLQRKIQEQYLAVELEEQVNNKDWILENYLNTINLGSNTLGVQAASLRYFGKDVSELTLSECAVIAGITKSPTAYNPISHPEKNAERRELVLNNMLEQEYITKEQYDEAMADDVYSRIAEHNTDQTGSSTNSYFVDAAIDDVFNDLVEELGWTETEAYKAIYQGGLSIYTTQDLDMQEICDNEVNNLDNYSNKLKYSFSMYFEVEKADGTHQTYTHQTMLNYYQKSNANYNLNYSSEERCYEAIQEYQNDILEEGDSIVEGSESVTITLQPQVALTVIDQTTGEVKALVGGRGEKAGNRTLNRATDTPRQPGSTYKIIGCYAPALDAGGLTLATVQDNAPYTVGTKTYRNYNDVYTGYTTIREAITDSINIVTVKNLEQIGVNLAYQYAEDFGFTTLCDDDKNLGFCLGGLTNGVTNLELTAAYATIANGGEYLEPKFYTVVYDHDGNVLLDKTNTQESRTVLKETTAWLLTSAMEDVLTSGSGTRAYFGASMAQAGKSGTTSNSRDTLFAGYTPYYTCVVWGGYDDNAKQEGENTTYTKNIWKAVMSQIHEGLPYKDFTMPSGITTATVCRKSGKLAVEGVCDADPRGSMVITEYFTEDTVPTEECDHHVALNICTASGLIADYSCPADSITTGIYIVGGTEGSTEYEMNVTEEFLNERCTVHSTGSVSDYVPTVPSVPTLPSNGELTQTRPGSSTGGTTSGSSSGETTSGGTTSGETTSGGNDSSVENSGGDNSNGDDGSFSDNAQGGTNGGNE
jgi:penicillin-binding protein 1A